MSQNETRRKKPSELPSLQFLGRDTRGFRHYYSALQKLLVVRDEHDEIVHERYLDNLEGWIDAIDDDHGWARLDYDRRGPWAGLANDVAKMLGGDD